MNKERKNINTVPPSTPQGPARNMDLTDPEYRKRTWPGDDPAQPAGEGSGARSRPSEAPTVPAQASDDAIVQHPADNSGSSSHDPDEEQEGGMSGGLGKEAG